MKDNREMKGPKYKKRNKEKEKKIKERACGM